MSEEECNLYSSGRRGSPTSNESEHHSVHHQRGHAYQNGGDGEVHGILNEKNCMSRNVSAEALSAGIQLVNHESQFSLNIKRFDLPKHTQYLISSS